MKEQLQPVAPAKAGLPLFLAASLRSDAVVTVTVLILSLAQAFYSEKIPVNNGLGWDGTIYAEMAKNFYTAVFVEGVPDLRLQKMLPSAVVHYSCRLTGVHLSDRNIIKAFSILDAVLLALSAYLWCRIGVVLGISLGGKGLGLVALFCNYGLLKHAFYYPVLPDMAGFCLGILLLYAYLTRQSWLLYLATLISCFSWPAGLVTGAFMILFPREQEVDDHPQPHRYSMHLILAVLLAAGLVWQARSLVRSGYRLQYGADQPIVALLKLSYLVCFVYVTAVVAALLNWDKLFRVSYLVQRLRHPGFYVGLAFLVLTAKLPSLLSNGEPVSGNNLLNIFIFESIAKPGVFLIAHINYFGPILLLALFLWRPVCRLIHQHGVGLTLSLTFAAINCIDTESRHLISYFPLLVPFVVKAIDRLDWQRTPYIIFAVCSLLMSKIWLTINPLPADQLFLEFPWQLYFMSVGPWMSGQMYLAQGAAVIVCGLMLFPYVKSRAEQTNPGLPLTQAPPDVEIPEGDYFVPVATAR